MFSWIQNIYHRKPKTAPQPLCIEGVVVKLTPRPDDAEMAATALLDVLTGGVPPSDKKDKPKPEKGTPAYYHDLSHRIQTAYAHEARMAQRLIAYCEAQISEAQHEEGWASALETELYSVQTIVERERGTLLECWQHCLAEVVVRQMNIMEVEETPHVEVEK